MDRSGADADQDVTFPHDRPGHIGVLEHLGRPVAALHDGLHPRLGPQGVAYQGLVAVSGCCRCLHRSLLVFVRAYVISLCPKL
jgi:hypothetical protein